MRNPLTHALSNEGSSWSSSSMPEPREHSTDRVLRQAFWLGGSHRPLGTLTTLADARAKKLRPLQR
jgi:hypothetical protein